MANLDTDIGDEVAIEETNMVCILPVGDKLGASTRPDLEDTLRLAFTQQLGALGDAVPTVTQVLAHAQSNGTLLVTLTGTHFVPDAELLIDGRAEGMMSQRTSEQLVAVISTSVWLPGEHALGVHNPDGTASQMVLSGEGDDHKRYATPQPTNDSGE